MESRKEKNPALAYTYGGCLLFCLLFLTNGCGRSVHNPGNPIADHTDHTLRSGLTVLQNEVHWAEELEGGLLEEKDGSAEGVSARIRLSPAVMAVVKPQWAVPVYPSIEGFGSLDCAGIGTAQRNILDGFCSAIASDTAADAFMTEAGNYSLVMFLADFRTCFPEAAPGKKKITGWIYGKPFVSEELYQVPVRFKSAAGFLDIDLYLDGASMWKIDQIQTGDLQAGTDVTE